MCNTLVEKYKPIGRYQEDVKIVNVKCGNTWIDGSDVLCDQCESEGKRKPYYKEEYPLDDEDCHPFFQYEY
jgi:hypothetical protein|tara:strand:- start:714 stop:926 length:213 start_codon:yes stop_codon:yes gene_type:complete